MKIFVGSDHAGFGLKEKLVPYLKSLGYEVIDKGASEYNEADDFPEPSKPSTTMKSDFLFDIKY